MADMDFLAGIVSFAAASGSLGAGRELSSPTASLVTCCVEFAVVLDIDVVGFVVWRKSGSRLASTESETAANAIFTEASVYNYVIPTNREPKAERLGNFMAYVVLHIWQIPDPTRIQVTMDSRS
ncbi:hypothetical protein OROMI_008851 [Orobanche minor]